MNANNHSTSSPQAATPQAASPGAEPPAAAGMQPVGRILDLVADATRVDDPWYWRDRWAD